MLVVLTVLGVSTAGFFLSEARVLSIAARCL